MALNFIFKFGVVVSVSDDLDGGRVRVYIRGVDAPNYSPTDVPYAFPLLPKLLHTKPKVGETVFVLTQDGSYDNDRYYIGPIISQPHKLESDTLAPDAFLKGGLIEPDVPPSKNPENRGVQPNDEDIAILGRGSTDILVKPHEVQIRAGKSLDAINLNKKNPTYIQAKYDTAADSGQINLVSNKINLLSHDSLTKFNLVDPDSLITDEELKKILENSHQLPFGDKLVQYLELQRKAFLTHIHPYHNMTPDAEQIEIKNYVDFDLNSMLSDNVRIN